MLEIEGLSLHFRRYDGLFRHVEVEALAAISLTLAISTSSVTGLALRSDRCISGIDASRGTDAARLAARI